MAVAADSAARRRSSAAPAPAPAAPAALPPAVAGVLRAPAGGDRLRGEVAGPIARSLGEDVSPVRVHAGAEAQAAAAALGARAFAFGQHVFLGAGERPTDLRVMAHEVAHVMQQRGTPAVQLWSPGPALGLEGEAHRAAAAVAAGRPARVTGRTGGRVVQRLDILGGIGRGISAVAGAVTEAAGDVMGRAVAYLRDNARSIPGYDLLGLVLGRDPITMQPVTRTPTNVIRAVLGLAPGGAALFDNLQRAGVLERAFAWVSAEIERLGLTWAAVRGAVERFLGTLGPRDLFDLGGVLARARAIVGPVLARVRDFALAAAGRLAELVFEGALALAGSAGQRVLAIFRRIGATFRLIVDDPVRFLGNLLAAVKGGLQRFGANILDHLRTAVFDWLLGALRGAVTLPRKLDLMGIVSVVLQVLGLTYARLRERLVRVVGEPAARFLETAFDFLKTLVTEGLAAAWQKVLEFAGGLYDQVVEGIKSWVAQSVVVAAITRLATMFNPVGALIQAVMGIYNTVMFFIERAQQIAALVESIVDSVHSIATGKITAAIEYVERTMARTLPVILGFLARFLGLGNVAGKIREIIQRIQAVVERAIDRVVDWVKRMAAGLLRGRRDAPAVQGAAGAAGDIRGRARRMVESRLPRDPARADVVAVIGQVRAELAPEGLKRLELGAAGTEQEYVVSAEASPFEELLDYMFSDRESVYTRMFVRLRGDTPLVADPTAIPGTVPVLGPEGPGGTRPVRAAAFERVEGKARVGGIIMAPQAGTTELYVGTWNTADAARRTDNRTHAEFQFMTWLGRQPLPMRQAIREIDVDINYSPCARCVGTLNDILGLIPGAQRPRATLTYHTVYRRRLIGTTAAALARLTGWSVSGPKP